MSIAETEYIPRRAGEWMRSDRQAPYCDEL